MRSLLTIITACGRDALLEQTKQSLIANTDFSLKLEVYNDLYRVGQNWNLNQALQGRKEKYYLHCEDDWLIQDTNKYWVDESLKILADNPRIIKVINRSDSVHPCDFEHGNYGILNHWVDPWCHVDWFGFGWNVGVTRLDLLQRFMPIVGKEQDLSKRIHDAGYKVALLKNSTAIHIGGEQSTHN